MSSGQLKSRWRFFSMSQLTESVDPALLTSLRKQTDDGGDRCWAIDQAVRLARDWLLNEQHETGYWCGELEGDSILESEYILLLTWLGRGQSEAAKRCAKYILSQQLPTGGWGLYPGAPLEISASVKAYLALKITGADPQSEPLARAREAIRKAGGAERVNSFTRYYLALLGIIEYRQCPAVPPELVLLPRWAPFNVSEMSAWSRTIIVPLSLLWAFQPRTTLPAEHRIDELFLDAPERLPASMPPCEVLDTLKSQHWMNWEKVFRGIDRCWKGMERLRLLPLRRLAIRRATRWMTDRLADSDGLGAIFPPIVWSIIALRCLGHAEDSEIVQRQLRELEALVISEDGVDRLQPCKSPVWDTAIALLALRDAEVPPAHPAIRQAAEWLLSKECRRSGDWSAKAPHLEPSGWYFEFNNAFYPDIDDTAMVVMALAESLGGRDAQRFTATLIPGDSAGSRNAKSGQTRGRKQGETPLSTIVSGRVTTPEPTPDAPQDGIDDVSPVLADLDRMRTTLDALRRGVRWMLAMQSRNGGWGAFDADNTRELLTRVPFADHNAMIDPPTADITARVLEMFGRLGIQQHASIDRALQFVWDDQEPDHAWYGRWGVNYIYGTWQVIVGLTAIGVAPHDIRLQRAADWLEVHQQACGGWGETARSYDEPHLRGRGNPTPSQTAWALMGLMAAGRTNTVAVRRGAQYLVDSQNADGSWDETEFTGTGFPKVFYLRYHLYSQSFPLMALGRYRRLTRE
jgi:squalene-hopene/tetraprenyl-beta-curcumene cyclase